MLSLIVLYPFGHRFPIYWRLGRVWQLRPQCKQQLWILVNSCVLHSLWHDIGLPAIGNCDTDTHKLWLKLKLNFICHVAKHTTLKNNTKHVKRSCCNNPLSESDPYYHELLSYCHTHHNIILAFESVWCRTLDEF